MTFDLHRGDCLAVMKTMADNSVDSIVTDPPYGLGQIKDLPALLQDWLSGGDGKIGASKSGFLSKDWDCIVPSPQVWKEALRILKPGGYIACFAGTRMYDLMTLSLRLGGFTIRDTLMYHYASGFPKSQNISLMMDKAAGAKREVIGIKPGHEEFANRTTKGHIEFKEGTEGFDRPWMHNDAKRESYHQLTAPATDDAKKYAGFGTALKPSWEPIILAQKPLTEKTIAKNVIKYGTGGLNIDASRIESTDSQLQEKYDSVKNNSTPRNNAIFGKDSRPRSEQNAQPHVAGRFPSNTIFAHHEDCVESGTRKVKGTKPHPVHSNVEKYEGYGTITQKKGEVVNRFEDEDGFETVPAWQCVNDCPVRILEQQSSGTSRFFYTPKASRKEKNKYLPEGIVNNHPTVKPLSIMRYLVKLINPPDGVVLDCYMGSGSTGVAAIEEGFSFIGIELDEDPTVPAFEIARTRINGALEERKKKEDTPCN